jgi:polysaccharide biosynthesis transport protein
MPEQFDDTAEFSLRDVLETVRRRKWIVIQAFVFVSIIGTVTAILSPPVYATNAKLLVETPASSVLRVINKDSEDPIDPIVAMRTQQSVDTQLAIMRSAEFRRRVDDKLRGQSGGVFLDYRPVDRTSIIDVVAEGPDQKLVADVANAASDAYVELTDQTNGIILGRMKKHLTEQQAESKRALDKAEKALLAFKVKTRIAEPNKAEEIRQMDALEAERNARQTRTDLLAVESQLKMVKNRLAKLPEMVPDVRITPNPEVESVRQAIAQLKSQRAVALGRYTADSTRIQDMNAEITSLEETLKTYPLTLRDDLTKPNPSRELLENQRSDLEMKQEMYTHQVERLEKIAATKSEDAGKVAPWGVEMDRLEREKEAAVKAYTEYTEQLRVVTLQKIGTGEGPTATVMEKAGVPGSPIRPQKAQQVALAMMMGLMLGVGFAFLQEFLDDRINSSEDIQRITALATLGVVPTIPESNHCLLIGQDAFSPVTESYRSLRTSVQYSSIDRKIHLLGVTSAHAGEGKSVTSANLAIAMALQGKRVILADTDLRRPTLHRMFGLEAEPGLTSVLAGELALEEALHPTAIEGLKVLTAGPLPPNPPELLHSQTMLDLMEEMKEHADIIIFDTTPTIPVTDAQVLGPHLDGMILVVEAGQARKAAVKHARDLLDRTRVRILGVVLNKIDQSSKGYYHQYYYGGRGAYRREEPAGTPGRPLGGFQENVGAAPSATAVAEPEGPRPLPDRLRDWE